MREKLRLGDILLKEKIIDEEKLNKALSIQKITNKRLGKIIVELELATEDRICDALANQLNIPKVSLKDREFTLFEKKLTLIIKKKRVLPLSKNNNTLVLAMIDPLDVITIDDIRRMTGCLVKPVIATESEMDEAIKRYEEREIATEVLQKQGERLSQFVSDITKKELKPFSIDAKIFLEATKAMTSPIGRDIELEDILGDVLVRKGVITQSQLDIAKEQRRERKLGDVLVELRFVQKGKILSELTNILFKI
ncbi:TPA: hypothetical protein DCX16_05875 [bacterium]|nr:hypothetical protein [bacterium]